MTDLRKLLIEARAWIVANEKHESVCPTRVMGTWGRCRCGFVSIIGRIDAALSEKVEPVATVRVGPHEHGPFVFRETAYGADHLTDGEHNLYAAPADQWRRVEWIKCDDKLPMHHKDYWLCIEGGEFATIGRLNHQFNGDLYWCLENGNSSNDVPYAEVTHYAEIVRPDLPALPEGE